MIKPTLLCGMLLAGSLALVLQAQDAAPPKPKVVPEEAPPPPTEAPVPKPKVVPETAPEVTPNPAPLPPPPIMPAAPKAKPIAEGPATEVPMPLEPNEGDLALEAAVKAREMAEKLEKERLEREKAEKEKAEKDRMEAERKAQEKAEQERMAQKKRDEEEAAKIVKGKAVPMESVPTKPETATAPAEAKPMIKTSTQNDRQARTLFMSIPAPRGQIVDRNGEPLAANKMSAYLGVQFLLKDNLPDAEVLAYARKRMAYIQKYLPDPWTVKDEKILEHYKNRRWLPMLATRPLPDAPSEAARKELMEGVVFQPCYVRVYPQGRTACHLMGELGKTRPLPTGPIQNGDDLWPVMEGRSGLELRFQALLTGTPGKVNYVFSATGEKISEEIIEHPIPGATIVTTIDLFAQKTVERVLKERCDRGAMVIMDVQSGDLVAIASHPTYDPNLFAIGIRESEYKALLTDPDTPLNNRAAKGLYPPASTFKVLTALAAMESDKISGSTYFDCPQKMFVGDRFFPNWNKSAEGAMNVVDALKRSCNTWFYRASIVLGAQPITSMGVRFGLGQKTGFILPEETGLMPTPEWWMAKRRHKISAGDLANICIGQGDVQVTPLQDCCMMAGIAKGTAVPKPRLVSQTQTTDGRILEFFAPENRSELSLQPNSLFLVRKGMRAVVEDSNGTGKAARNKFVDVAGKTGTGQWKFDKYGRRVHCAWFGGYIPANEPQFAFAAIYEGNPGESSISGGKKVAPIVGSVFNTVFTRMKSEGKSLTGPGDETLVSTGTKKARKVSDSEEGDTPSAPPKKALPTATEKPAEAPPEVPPAPQNEGGLRRFFKRLRGGE